jgi:cytochrome bd ubiquinol oxidase subunit I
MWQMEFDPVFLSRVQFAFLISFHIIFPSFTIGLAAWLTVIEAAHMMSGQTIYRRIFDFWLRVFSIAFGMGVVSGVVMAFQFGTNWSGLVEKTGSIQGPLLGYETFTAFLLEATFLGVVLFGRDRVKPWFYLLACALVTLGTFMSSFWIMANNSWMQVPVGHAVIDGKIVPDSWIEIIFGYVQRVRWSHMILACFITTGVCVVSTACWWLLKGQHRDEARVMLKWALPLLAILVPAQMFVGHLAGEIVLKHQPAKFAAIEARFQTQQPASEIIISWPDEKTSQNLYAIEIPKLGSFIASGDWTSKQIGLDAFPVEDRPPVLIPFFGFRLMVGMGLLILGIAWGGCILFLARGYILKARWFQWIAFLSFPSGFLAILAGWFTAEVGRQPWVVYGLLRTADAVTPSLKTGDVLVSLAIYGLVYALIYTSGLVYLYRILRDGPKPFSQPIDMNAKRPVSLAAHAQKGV